MNLLYPSPLPQSPPCFYRSLEWTNSTLVLEKLRDLSGRFRGRWDKGVFSCLRSGTSPLDATKSYTLDLGGQVNLPQGSGGRAASAAGTKLSSSPPPETGPARRTWRTADGQHGADGVFCLSKSIFIMCMLDLHSRAGTQLRNTFGLLELFAEIQKLHTERMTCKKQRQNNISSHRHHAQCFVFCFFFNTKPSQHSLLLCGEDFKAAVREHLIEHLKERDRHPGGKKGARNWR